MQPLHLLFDLLNGYTPGIDLLNTPTSVVETSLRALARLRCVLKHDDCDLVSAVDFLLLLRTDGALGASVARAAFGAFPLGTLCCGWLSIDDTLFRFLRTFKLHFWLTCNGLPTTELLGVKILRIYLMRAIFEFRARLGLVRRVTRSIDQFVVTLIQALAVEIDDVVFLAR